MECVMQRDTEERIDGAQPREGRPGFVAGALLAELLSDPMTQRLMAADRVEHREFEVVRGLAAAGPFAARAPPALIIVVIKP
jgi:hypothetical protein